MDTASSGLILQIFTMLSAKRNLGDFRLNIEKEDLSI